MKNFEFYLFVARVNEANLDDYDRYILDEDTHISLLMNDLGVADFEYLGKKNAYNYGIHSLHPDFRYELPVNELFKYSVLKKEDMPQVSQFCTEKGIVPNSYIFIYRQNLALTDDFTLSFPDVYFVGKFTMSEVGLSSQQLHNPHLF